ncbi:hypothetical protein KEJ14_04075 [Candidatus Bathyarchaeota archaeon]|nr:hypothetical protein [Candidatus Bathyarchaeota archaeon]
MSYGSYNPVYLEGLAEEALRRGDYESAARFFHYLTAHYSIMNDKLCQRRFAIKAGECYMLAAEKVNDLARAIALYLRAARIFRDYGDTEMAHSCGLKAWEHYTTLINEEGFRWDYEGIHALKLLGDFLTEEGDLERAARVYWDAAEKALRSGKIHLASGLYRDAGDRYMRMGNMGSASKSYLMAAEAYFRCQEYFEAAWHYCEAGFMLLCLKKPEEALEASEKAELACYRGQIEVFLKDLSQICKLLSKGSVHDAEKIWDGLQAKFRKEYVQLVELSFEACRLSSS